MRFCDVIVWVVDSGFPSIVQCYKALSSAIFTSPIRSQPPLNSWISLSSDCTSVQYQGTVTVRGSLSVSDDLFLMRTYSVLNTVNYPLHLLQLDLTAGIFVWECAIL